MAVSKREMDLRGYSLNELLRDLNGLKEDIDVHIKLAHEKRKLPSEQDFDLYTSSLEKKFKYLHMINESDKMKSKFSPEVMQKSEAAKNSLYDVIRFVGEIRGDMAEGVRNPFYYESRLQRLKELIAEAESKIKAIEGNEKKYSGLEKTANKYTDI